MSSVGDMHGLRVLGVVALALTACVGSEPGRRAASSEVAPPVLTIVSDEYSFEAPEQFSGGVVTVVLDNRNADEMHHATLLKLDDGRTLQDFVDFVVEAHKPPTWVTHFGGPEDVLPGRVGRATVILEPGSFLLVCYVGTGFGAPHLEKGMIRDLEVLEPEVLATEPEHDVILTMKEYGYVLSDSLHAGSQTVRIESTGEQPHNLLIYRLKPEKQVGDFVAWWFAGREGVAPGDPMGGYTALDPGRHGFFELDLEPGSYVFFCLVEDQKDARPHLMYGMVREVTIT